MWQLVTRFAPVLVGLFVIAAMCKFAYQEGADSVQLQWQADKLAVAQLVEQTRREQAQTQLAHTLKIQQAQEANNVNQDTIFRLNNQLHGLRIHLPTCADTLSANPAAVGDKSGTSGLFSERMDAAFERLQSGTSELVRRCDTLNAAAIMSNSETQK